MQSSIGSVRTIQNMHPVSLSRLVRSTGYPHEKRSSRFARHSIRSSNHCPSYGNIYLTVSQLYRHIMQQIFFFFCDKIYGSVGHCFSRNPTTGEKGCGLVGEVWGIDGVKRILTTSSNSQSISTPSSGLSYPMIPQSSGAVCKETFQELQVIGHRLETHFRDMQSFEFVVDDIIGKIFVIQCRPGRRTPKAAVTIAVDMVNEQVIITILITSDSNH